MTDQLTPRESSVLSGLLEGKSNKEIAAGLGLTTSTVNTYVSKLMQKTGTDNRLQLVVKHRMADFGSFQCLLTLAENLGLTSEQNRQLLVVLMGKECVVVKPDRTIESGIVVVSSIL